MIAGYLSNLVTQNLGYHPTKSQETLIGQLTGFILDNQSNQVFIVKGFAGTGKTTLISALVKSLDKVKIKTLLLAPTGRAAKVLASYAGKNAFTIHRKIYRQKSAKNGFGDFVINRNLSGNLVIIVDEASMISDSLSDGTVFGSGRLLADLISFVKDGLNCRLILIGDTAQLPPVGIVLSPALDRNDLAMYMPVAGEFMLTDIVRQNIDSGILYNATKIRNQIGKGDYSLPSLNASRFTDVSFITGNELIDLMENRYNTKGIDEVIVLCRSNKKANQYNSGVRKQVLFKEEEITAGDLLMVVKNNYYWLREHPQLEFIANGDILKILKIKKYTERYGFRFAFAQMSLIDYDVEFESWIILDTLMAETASLGQEENRKLYYSVLEDYGHLDSKAKQYKAVREDAFFNALQVKYAYALTCHKAQGGQWKTVFIDQGFVNKEKIDMEYLRWLYTAITRATEELFFVNFPADYKETSHTII
ncbi:MAG TPA: AAA family ATPase [Bacteroidales bacterium]|jgi:exodeoxyribonuclease-5|nr:AAA family ATPase [Bacteroidales bacterium]